MTANDLSTCEEMIMIVIWNSPTDLDLMSVLRATNDRFHTNWKPQTVSTFLTRARKKATCQATNKEDSLSISLLFPLKNIVKLN